MNLHQAIWFTRLVLTTSSWITFAVLAFCVVVVVLGYWGWAIVPFGMLCFQQGIVAGYHLRRLEGQE